MDLSKLKIQIEKKVRELGYDFYDLEFVKERKVDVLRILIDSANGIDINDCVKASNYLSTYLDEIDPIPMEYHLEISSPGAERPLRNREEIVKAIGKFVHIDNYEQKFEGDLIGFEDDYVIIKIKNKNIEIKFIDIQEIRLAIKF
ncbi:MAG: ribosome maturation factor RimP [Firmicutes bacterium]|nr:ribosome maturation factor RimP [Bacillota bacterium]